MKIFFLNKININFIFFLQAFDQIDGPDGIPQSVDVNDGPDYFNRSRSLSPYMLRSPPSSQATHIEPTAPFHKRSQSTFAEHPTPVRNVKRRLF